MLLVVMALGGAGILVDPGVEQVGVVGGDVVDLVVGSEVLLSEHPFGEAVAAAEGSDEFGRVIHRACLEPDDGGSVVMTQWAFRILS